MACLEAHEYGCGTSQNKANVRNRRRGLSALYGHEVAQAEHAILLTERNVSLSKLLERTLPWISEGRHGVNFYSFCATLTDTQSLEPEQRCHAGFTATLPGVKRKISQYLTFLEHFRSGSSQSTFSAIKIQRP